MEQTWIYKILKVHAIHDDLLLHLWGDSPTVSVGGYIPDELRLLSSELHRAGNRVAAYIRVCNRQAQQNAQTDKDKAD